MCLDVLPQVGPGPVSRTHAAPGEDLVPEQTHEVEENGKCLLSAGVALACTTTRRGRRWKPGCGVTRDPRPAMTTV